MTKSSFLASLFFFFIGGLQLTAACNVTGATYEAVIDGTSLTCEGTDVCKGATIVGCDTVTCGPRDCMEAIMTEVKTVNCNSESACMGATIGTAAQPATAVFCRGAEFTCYTANIFASQTIVCEDNVGISTAQGVCGHSKLETACLQCLGNNHGCSENCKLGGEDCPTCPCGGNNCTADVCHSVGEECVAGGGAAEAGSAEASSSAKIPVMLVSPAVGLLLAWWVGGLLLWN